MFSLEYFMGLKSSWETLKDLGLPVLVYGMGDGCVKLLRQFEAFGIKESGIFASDEFVRGHSFMGHKVLTLSQAEEQFGEFAIAVAFGAGYKSLMDKLDDISKRHKLLLPDTAVVGGEPFTKEYLKENAADAAKVWELLADEQSRLVFENVLAYKITGELHYLRDCESSPEEAYRTIVKPENCRTYVDLGAYNGDTVREYIQNGGRDSGIIAVEPDTGNFRKLTAYASELSGCECVNAAAWNCCGEVSFTSGGGRMGRVVKSGKPVRCVTVDGLLSGKPADHIKYDVEGAESKALEGTSETIRKYFPTLCVAVYHRLEDMFALPLQIYELQPEYKFYLRHYPYYPAWETNLFCKK